MALTLPEARELLESHGQGHVLQFWDTLDEQSRQALLADIDQVDFALMARLIDQWVLHDPLPEKFDRITPVPLIRRDDPGAADAWDAGETALCAGRVGLFLVAGGQGTRLGFSGPKGCYPIGPVSGKTLFEFHAEKIHSVQNRYGCRMPWYIMVSDSNEEATRAFFEKNGYLGLESRDVKFIRQRMVPCVDAEGRFLLAEPGRLAMNPNGHGGSIPAMVETGVLDDARARGVDILSYFQVDNWAVKVADPLFIGYHVLRNAGMSSKNHTKQHVRESVGVHCLCDGQYRVIEYTELDIYPQLLETGPNGEIIHAAGNPAIHLISVDFVEQVYEHYDRFPWHRAHKKIPYIDRNGRLVEPASPNGYKFETFIFDALRFIPHEPVCLEIAPPGEYTPIKQFDGPNSVKAAWAAMAEYWAEWLDQAGYHVPRDEHGRVAVPVEISPRFALSKEEFLRKTAGKTLQFPGPIGIDQDGRVIPPRCTHQTA